MIYGFFGSRSLKPHPKIVIQAIQALFDKEEPGLVYTPLTMSFGLDVTKICQNRRIPYIALCAYRNEVHTLPISFHNDYYRAKKKALEVIYTDRIYPPLKNPDFWASGKYVRLNQYLASTLKEEKAYPVYIKPASEQEVNTFVISATSTDEDFLRLIDIEQSSFTISKRWVVDSIF